MSLLDKFKGYEHTFTAWVTKELQKLRNAEPKIEEIADTVMQYAIPAIQIIVGAEAGQPAAALVGQIGVEAQKTLHALGGLIYDFGATPTAASIVSSVQSNLSGLLEAGHIKNPDNVANVNKVVNTLGALANALLPAAPAPGA